MKGQIFTIDTLVSLVALTAVLGMITWEFQLIFSVTSDMQSKRMELLANDVANIAVKRFLVERDPGGLNIPNKMDINNSDFDTQFTTFTKYLSELFNASAINKANVTIYLYDGSKFVPRHSWVWNGGCTSTDNNVAVVRRVLINDPYIYAPYEGSGNVLDNKSCGYIEVKIC